LSGETVITVAAALLGVTVVLVVIALGSTGTRRQSAGPQVAHQLTIWLGLLSALGWRICTVGQREKLLLSNARAGGLLGRTPEELFGRVGLFATGAGAAIGALLWLTLGPAGLLAGPAGLLLGPMVAESMLVSAQKGRARSVRRAMPYAVDLLVLTLRAGSSLTIAMERVGRGFVEEPIGQELLHTLADLRLGLTRREAFESLSLRVDANEVREFTTSVLMAEELGRPIADELQRLADRARTVRLQAAETTAGSASVYVLFPATIMLAVVLLLLFAPFIVRWMRGELSLG
jgi:tight adherence protein C